MIRSLPPCLNTNILSIKSVNFSQTRQHQDSPMANFCPQTSCNACRNLAGEMTLLWLAETSSRANSWRTSIRALTISSFCKVKRLYFIQSWQSFFACMLCHSRSGCDMLLTGHGRSSTCEPNLYRLYWSEETWCIAFERQHRNCRIVFDLPGWNLAPIPWWSLWSHAGSKDTVGCSSRNNYSRHCHFADLVLLSFQLDDPVTWCYWATIGCKQQGEWNSGKVVIKSKRMAWQMLYSVSQLELNMLACMSRWRAVDAMTFMAVLLFAARPYGRMNALQILMGANR